ncbi:helix-turn-helix domain-containing protein [Actinocorallia lasiicapitis]
MAIGLFSVEDFEIEERFERWYEFICDTYWPAWTSYGGEARDFEASAQVLPLGSLQFAKLSTSPLRYRRTSRQVRTSDPEVYLLVLQLQGVAKFDGTESGAVVRPRQFLLTDSSRPFTSEGQEGRGTVSLTIAFPRSLIGVPFSPMPLDMVVSAEEGMTALAANFFTDMMSRTGEYQDQDLGSLGVIASSLLQTIFAEWTGERPPPEARQNVLVLRIRAYIERNLADPGLNLATIAQAHQISVRQLQRIFPTPVGGVAAWIRHLRLRHCRDDLSDPGLDRLPVNEIARRWGFTDAAHFSRAFRDAFGMPPRDYRATTRAVGAA